MFLVKKANTRVFAFEQESSNPLRFNNSMTATFRRYGWACFPGEKCTDYSKDPWVT